MASNPHNVCVNSRKAILCFGLAIVVVLWPEKKAILAREGHSSCTLAMCNPGNVSRRGP